MAKYKPKAEQNFESRFAAALNDRDWSRVTVLLTMFGYYYQLAESESLVGTELTFEFAPVQPARVAPAWDYHS